MEIYKNVWRDYFWDYAIKNKGIEPRISILYLNITQETEQRYLTYLKIQRDENLRTGDK